MSVVVRTNGFRYLAELVFVTVHFLDCISAADVSFESCVNTFGRIWSFLLLDKTVQGEAALRGKLFYGDHLELLFWPRDQ